MNLKILLLKHNVSFVRYAAPTDSYSRLSRLFTTKLYFGKASKNSYIKYNIDGKLFKTKLTGHTNVNELILNQSLPYKEISIEFYTDTILDIYGVSFESPKGVFVDNYAVRGSPGMPLRKIPADILQGFNSYMNYSLLIFQFGLNVAAPEAKGFRWYEDQMVKVIEYYKKLFPKADILIISVGDKSYKHNMEYVTQPSITKLVEAQRSIARRTQSYFWNLYQSMGGYNSMKSWVETPKPLASKDYTHINFLGAEKVSKLLSDNILNEYKLYKYNLLKDYEKQQLLATILNANSKLNNHFFSFEKQYSFIYSNEQKLIIPKKTNYAPDTVTTNNLETVTIQTNETYEPVETNETNSATDTYEYRIQIGASKVELEEHTYDNILKKTKGKKLIKTKSNDGFYRYYIASYNSFEKAQAFTDSLYADIKDAFVVGFINDKFAKIEKVKEKQLEVEKQKQSQPDKDTHQTNVKNKTVYSEKSPTVTNPKFKSLKKNQKQQIPLNFADVYNGNNAPKNTLPNYIHQLKTSETSQGKTKNGAEIPVFRVLFCTSEVELDKSFYQNVIDYFGDSLIKISKDKDGLIKYMLGDYKSYEEAEKALKKVFELKQDGYIIAFQNNKRIKNEEAISIIKKMKK